MCTYTPCVVIFGSENDIVHGIWRRYRSVYILIIRWGANVMYRMLHPMKLDCVDMFEMVSESQHVRNLLKSSNV